MFKRFLSLALVAIVVLSMTVAAVSAAQVEIAGVGAEAGAEVGAESSASTGASKNTFSFDASTTGWKNYDKIGCYIWEYGSDNKLITWGSKKGYMKDNGNGIWTFNIDDHGISFDDSKCYGLIFLSFKGGTPTGAQTYDLIIGNACLGDTAYCDGSTLENPADSNKTCKVALWKNQDKTVYGPIKTITSIGNIVGDCIPSNSSAYDIFLGFVRDTLTNARQYAKNDDGSAKTDQQLIDDAAKNLGIGKDDIEKAIKEAGVTVDWKKDDSKANDKSDPGANEKGGTNGGSGNSSSGSGSGSSGSNGSSGGSGSSSSGGSSRSGSGSSASTGQGTTVLFIMLGVMVAAVGVIIFARKREITE